MTRYRKWERARIVEAVIRRLDNVITDERMVFWEPSREEDAAPSSYKKTAVAVKSKRYIDKQLVEITVDASEDLESCLVGTMAMNSEGEVYDVIDVTRRTDAYVRLRRIN